MVVHGLYQAQVPSAHSCHCCILSREAVHTHPRAAFVLSTVAVRAFAVADCIPDHTAGGGRSLAHNSERVQPCPLHILPRSFLGRNHDIPADDLENVPPLAHSHCIHPHTAGDSHLPAPANLLPVAHVGVRRFGEHLAGLAGRSILVVARRRSEQLARMPFC